MSKFVTSARSNQVLPKDMPNAKEAADKYADGTLYEADNGSKCRLRHAQWIPAKIYEHKAARAVNRATQAS